MPKVKKETPKETKKAKTTAVKSKEAAVVKKTGLSVPVYNLKGVSEKEMELPKEIFSVETSPKLLAQYVRVYLANQRQGNASSKTRSEVTGSTKKIYRQKGTGRARHGARKAPIFVGGGVVGGPQPRDFSLKMNKKQKRKALFYSLTLKAKENSIIGLTSKALETEPKTKIVVGFLKAAGLDSKKALLVLPNLKNNLWFASRNVSNLDVVSATSINPYEIMNHEKIIFTDDVVAIITNHFAKKNEN